MELLKKTLLFTISVFYFTGNNAQSLSDTISGSQLDTIYNFEPGLFYGIEPSASLESSELQNQGLVSLTDVLQGKISGLDIITASGERRNPPKIVTRGLSLSGQLYPLIVIDGIPQSRFEQQFNLYNYNVPDIRYNIPVALEDIESIKMIKDPLSSLIYGSEAVDGAIVIETKNGNPGKLKINYQFNHATYTKTPAIPLLNGDEYMMLQLEEWHNRGGVFDVPPEISYNQDYEDFYNYSANTDWLNAVLQNGALTNHNLNISGGNRKNRFYASVDYQNETGMVINSGFKNFISRINYDHYFNDKLSLAIRSFYTESRYQDNYLLEDEFGNSINILRTAYFKAPNMSILEYNSNGNLTGDYFTPYFSYQGNGVNYYNPVAVSELGKAKNTTNELLNSLSVQYKIANWLTFRETVTYSQSKGNSKAYLPWPAIGYDIFNSQGYNENSTETTFTRLRNETSTFFHAPFKESNNHNLCLNLAWIYEKNEIKFNIDNSEAIMYYGPQEPKTNAVASSINYGYKDKYLLNINTRLESFQIYDKKTWHKNYGATASWVFSKESFMDNFKFLTHGQLNTSRVLTSYHPTWIGNPHPLDISSWNIGMDLNLFRNKLILKTTQYNKLIKSILLRISSMPETFIETKNYGWEFMFNYQVLESKNWNWTFDFNATFNRNILKNLPQNHRNSFVSLGKGEYSTYLEINKEYGSIYGFIYEGVYSTDEDAIAHTEDGSIITDSEGNPIPMNFMEMYIFEGGDAKYKDLNYDGTINENDLVYLGNSHPKYIGGFGSRLQYKNIDFSFKFHYRFGYKIINRAAIELESMDTRNNQSKSVLRRWRVQGQDEEGMLPRAYMNHPTNNLGSDRYVENGNFVRLNNINLGYTFKPELFKKIGIKSLYAYFSAQRLLTFTGYSGIDPEVENASNNLLWMSEDNIRLYPPKSFNFGFKVGI